MKHRVEPGFRRMICLAVPLALVACQPAHDAGRTKAGESQTAAARSASSASAQAGSSGSQKYAEHMRARSLARQQYELILEWVRREGLEEYSYAEFVELAETDAAASRYVGCHEASKSPTGHDSRLELLSTCLMQDSSADSATVTSGLSVASACVEAKPEIVAPPACTNPADQP